MNIELIREQLKEVEIQEVCVADDVLNKIRDRRERRRVNLRIVAVSLVLFISIGTIQFEQI